MDEAALTAGFRALDSLAAAEYHQSLQQILDGNDEDAADRIGRLIGVLIKEPFADPEYLESRSSRTGAYRAWHLKSNDEFSRAASANPWQYQLLEYIRIDRELSVRDEFFPGGGDTYSPEVSIFDLAQEAHHESGFWGLYAQTLQKYICGDKVIRRKVDEAFRNRTKVAGLSVKAPTPESLVGTSGLALGGFLVHAVPALGMAGAPAIAAVLLVLYTLGVDAFCKWSGTAKTTMTENN